MPASKQGKVLVTCPHCGHSQEEPRAAFSTICKKCRRNFRVQEVLNHVAKAPEAPVERRAITCFECGRELEVPVSAQSSMCKWCSSHIDLQDYRITAAVSRNFKTKGSFALEATGYVFNTEALVGDVLIKGRFLGKLVAERSLAIHSTAEIKGTFPPPGARSFPKRRTDFDGKSRIKLLALRRLRANWRRISRPKARSH